MGLTYVRVIPPALRVARREAQLSQRAVAEAAGISCSYVAMLETGKRLRAELTVMERVAKTLKVDLVEIAFESH